MSDEDVRRALSTYSIGLTVEEARKIEQLLQRPPTVVEAVIWGIQGSEHSSYKSSRRFLKNFTTSGKHVILGPKEDSGIVALTDGPPGKRWGVVISHESHNHPSQVVPFEGAATGVGGTVRDVACMGARVVGCMDMLRLGDLSTPMLRGIASEVMRGIAGYGNPLGVPNLGGDTVFHSGFNGNCLVNAIAIGIVREDEVIHSEVPDEAAREHYDIILVGKPTDRSGFGGAAFASLSIDEEKRDQNTGAVQEPNPFLERHLLASTYALFDWLVASKNLHRVGFKDLGAGGVVCASVEQVAGKGFGATVRLDDVHTSIRGLPPEVIACAETQERFCWTCHPSLTQHIVKHYNVDWDLPSVAEGARASVIGFVTDDGIYTLTHVGEIVCQARATDITLGLQYTRPTADRVVSFPEPTIACSGSSITVSLDTANVSQNLQDIFLAMLRDPNNGSKECVYKHFDKTVIGNTIVEAGEADAAVIAPLRDLASYCLGTPHPGWDVSAENEKVGAVFAADGNPRHGVLSAYAQGYMAAAESICNVVAVGGTPRALTDCLNYGNPEIPQHLRALEEGVQGIADASRALHFDDDAVPVISGNVSLYNSLPDGSSIPPSAIVCCVGVIPDAHNAVTMQCKRKGSKILLLGDRSACLGASAYYAVLEQLLNVSHPLGGRIPTEACKALPGICATVLDAVNAKLVLASHDISDGGLALALFEMLCPQREVDYGLGVRIDLGQLPDLRSDVLLFSEAPGFLLEVAEENFDAVIGIAEDHGVHVYDIGVTTDDARLSIMRQQQLLMDVSLLDAKNLWQNALPQALHQGN
jgi:phosphoribosylformylglycinamidine synthase